MGKSARVLGWEFGRNAREMNALLKQQGYLDGEPGAYGLTEKGKQYGRGAVSRQRLWRVRRSELGNPHLERRNSRSPQSRPGSQP